MNKKKLLVIDGNSLFFRAYYATAYKGTLLRTSTGQPINGVVAFFNMLNSIIEQLSPWDIVIAFDKGKKTFRHKEMKDYKGKRSKTPIELLDQFPIVKELLNQLEIAYYESDKYEADDIVASIARKYENTYAIWIISSDHDLLQLVNENISVIQPRQGLSKFREVTIDNFVETFLHAPDQVISVKSIAGDSSDNIVGVPGIGSKGAINLITQFGNIELLYEKINEVKSQKVREKLLDNKENVFHFAKYIELVDTIDLPDKIRQKQFEFLLTNDLLKFIEKYELNNIKRKLINKYPKNSELIHQKINEIFTKNNGEALNSNIYVHLALNSDNYHIADLLGISIIKNGKILFFDNLEDQELIKILNSADPKIVFNEKKIKYFLNKNKIKINNVIDDLAILYYVLNPSIKNTVFDISNNQKIEMISRDDFLTKTYIRKPKPKQDIKTLVTTEIKVFPTLYERGIDLLYKNALEDIYFDIERPTTQVLLEMEQTGIGVDVKFLKTLGEDINAQIKDIKEQIYLFFDEKVNLDSPFQTLIALKDTIKNIDFIKNTSSLSLKKIINKHPVVKAIIAYRKLSKLNSAYIEGLQKFIIKDKIHTIFDQTMTETGRLSSKFPNMQNLATHDDSQKIVKKAFVAKEGYTFLFADYSQIESRVFTHLSQSKEFINYFKNDYDIHKTTASEIFKVELDKVTPEMRQKAKAVNFGIMYGLSPFGLAQQLNISFFEASQIINVYNSRYPSIANYQKEQIKKAFDAGYATTLFGRKRLFPTYKTQTQFYKRVAINMPIQGTVADIMKIAAIEITKILKKSEANLLLQIHDELVFEIKEDLVEKYEKLIKNNMENIIKISIPLPVSIKQSKSLLKSKI